MLFRSSPLVKLRTCLVPRKERGGRARRTEPPILFMRMRPRLLAYPSILPMLHSRLGRGSATRRRLDHRAQPLQQRFPLRGQKHHPPARVYRVDNRAEQPRAVTVLLGGPVHIGTASERSDIPRNARLGKSQHGRQLLHVDARAKTDIDRSEEHTSELQSLMRISYAVFCLQKKNTDK